MKIRSGFVSNSSSSSFILGIAEVLDEGKLRAYMKKHNIQESYDVKIVDENDTYEHIYSTVKVNKDGVATADNWATDVSTKLQNQPAKIFVLNTSGHHDDCDFWNGDWYDYDIDLSDFGDDKQMLYNMFSDPESGLSMDGQVTYGAGRDG